MGGKFKALLMAFFLFCVVVAASQRFYVTPALGQDGSEAPIVVCTTTVLASIVEDLGGDLVTVEVIASPAVCPAHYDVKPSDVEAFRRASLILMHGFEPWVEELREASGSEAPVVKIPGPWNTPEALKSKYSLVADALRENLGIDVSARLERCLASIDETERWLKEYAEENGFVGTPVVCMLWQKGFISFLGFNVVATYGPPEKVSAKEYEAVIKNATEFKAVLVIDNIQSGVELGKKIASEIGAVEVAQSNFPGIALGLNNMTSVMRWNVEKLAEALESSRSLGEVSRLKSQISTWKTATAAASVISAAELLIIAVLVTRLRRG